MAETAEIPQETLKYDVAMQAAEWMSGSRVQQWKFIRNNEQSRDYEPFGANVLITLSHEAVEVIGYRLKAYVRTKAYADSIAEGDATASLLAADSSIHCRFVLHSYALSPAIRVQIQNGVDTILENIQSTYGLNPSENFQITMRIFGNEEEFVAHKGAVATKTPVRLESAYYSVAEKEIVTWVKSTDESFLKSIYHESVHAILREALRRRPPVWFNEGNAEYFAYKMVGNTPYTQRNIKRKKTIARSQLEAGRLKTVQELFDVSDAEADLEMTYGISWCFVEFLLESLDENAIAGRVFNELKNGASSRAAFERHYPGGMQRLEQDWEDWVRWL